MYEKFSTFLRLEVPSNNLPDFGLPKSLDNLEAVQQTLASVTDRLATFEVQALHVQGGIVPNNVEHPSKLSSVPET